MARDDWKGDGGPEEFWAMVDLARRDFAGFAAALRAADRRGLIRFAWWFEYYQGTLRRAPYVDTQDPDLSEDALDDLADEVVGRGKAFYDDVRAHPERMPVARTRGDPSHKMRVEAGNAYHERHGAELPPYGDDY